ncbi:MAG: AMP-binding protein [Acidimicrobiales bacterium]|nr:AMP-binding protein [Acidimicrobiales bacterium]
MPHLVALDLPAGPGLVDAVARCWDAGDAVAIVDRHAPDEARRRWLDAVRPHRIATADEPTGRPFATDAAPLEAGDALVVTTSGSTGEPAVLVHTRAGLTAHAAASHLRLGVDPDRDRWLACLPLTHLGGFGVVARSLLTATPLDVLDGFDVARVAAAPGDLGTTLVSLVPRALDQVDPTAFRRVLVGGSADPRARPANVVRTYGSTETGGGVVYDGRPLDGVEVGVEPDGTIAVRAPTLARGRRRPDGSVAPITDGDGWFATGDRGHWDGERLEVLGRADDLIVTGGENVWPGPVEAILATDPRVAAVAVVGEPDPDWGQRVVALVVPSDPAAPPALEDLRELVRDRLGAPAAPRELRLVAALERTALGKVRRPAAPEPR